jgi:hypothetical protein
MILDIGCGKRKAKPQAVGIDVSADSAADHIWSLDRYPWLLEDDRFTRIHMSHVIEHLDDPMRVARDGASVFVTTPHFSSNNSYVDPTHKRHLVASFECFTDKDFPTFAGFACRFDIVTVELTFGGNFVPDNLGHFLAHASLPWYERHAAWIFPELDIRCHLRARKS